MEKKAIKKYNFPFHIVFFESSIFKHVKQRVVLLFQILIRKSTYCNAYKLIVIIF